MNKKRNETDNNPSSQCGQKNVEKLKSDSGLSANQHLAKIKYLI